MQKSSWKRIIRSMRLKQERRSGSLKRDLEHKVEAYC